MRLFKKPIRMFRVGGVQAKRAAACL